MKIVVSNTSPLRYLIQIGELDVLPQLFGKLFIPQAVFEELVGWSERQRTPTIAMNLA